MLFLITVPANNNRGPRYMEKSLAAMHQARLRHPVTLIYGSSDEQVGLFVRCHAADREAVLEPIITGLPVGLHGETRDLAAGCLLGCLDFWLDARPNTIMRLWNHRPVDCMSEKMTCRQHPKSWAGIYLKRRFG